MVWTSGDRVMINGAWYGVTPDTGDPTTALIVDVPQSNSYTAVYAPQSTMDDTQIKFYLPADQYYAENSFATETNPMVAYSTSTDLAFKNLCGIIRLGVTGSTRLASAVFTDNSARQLAGEASLLRNRLESGDYTVRFGPESRRYITYDCNEAPQLGASPQYLYLIVPPATYARGFSLTLIDTDGNVCVRTTNNSLTVERSQIKDMEAFAFTPEQTPVAVAAGQSEATALQTTVTAAPCAALRVHAIAKSLWDSMLAEDPGRSEAALMEQILIEGIFTRSGTNGSVNEILYMSYTRTGNTSLTADTDYYMLAGYNAGYKIAGAVKIAVKTAPAQGDAPTLAFARKTPAERPFAKSILNIASNAAAIRFCHLSGTAYDELKASSDDARIVTDHGIDLTPNDVQRANSTEGFDLQTDGLISETRYVLLATATSAGGAATTSKTEYTTPPYIDPTAVWTTVSTTTFWDGIGLFQYWDITGYTRENITVQKMEGAAMYRLVNVFRTPQFAEMGFVPTAAENSYLYIDATNRDNVVIEPFENNLGINYLTESGNPDRWTSNILMGSAALYQGGGEPGRVEQDDPMNLVINLGSVIVHGTDFAGMPLHPMEVPGGMLVIRINSFTGAGTENFTKESATTPW